MIKITIKGNTKRFEPGTTVYDILNSFDIQFLHFACAVEMNGEIVGMDEEIGSDCELKLLTFNDLSERDKALETLSDGLISDEAAEETESGPSDAVISEVNGELSYQSGDAVVRSDEDIKSIEDVLFQLEGEQMSRIEPEDVFGSDEAAYETADDYADAAPSETVAHYDYDEIWEEAEPETDGEFVSVVGSDNGELSPEMVGYDAESIDAENVDEISDVDDETDDGSSSDDSADDMQMHLGVPKIDDLVSELLLNIDPSAFDITGSKECLAATYDLLAQLEPLMLRYRGTKSQQACVRHGEVDYSAFMRFSKCDLAVSYGPRMSAKPLGACLAFELTPEKFLLIGLNCTPAFHVKPGIDRKLDILRMEEGRVVNGEWISGRVLNGDEKMNLRFGDMPSALMVDLYQY